MTLKTVFKAIAKNIQAKAVIGGLGLSMIFSGCASATGFRGNLPPAPGNAHHATALRNADLPFDSLSFPYIMRTGDVPTYKGDQARNNYRIDFQRKDAFTHAMELIENRAAERIVHSSSLQSLLHKKKWTKEDRQDWERGISRIVSEEMDRIPGLGDYRQEKQRGSFLNDLSSDIEHNTKSVEFDCEGMTIVEGVTLQRLDNRFLPPPKEDSYIPYKAAATYFYAGGYVDFDNSGSEVELGGHAFIVSSASAAIVEATSEPANGNDFGAYRLPLDPRYSFRDFVDNVPAVTFRKDGTIDVYMRDNSTSRAAHALEVNEARINELHKTHTASASAPRPGV